MSPSSKLCLKKRCTCILSFTCMWFSFFSVFFYFLFLTTVYMEQVQIACNFWAVKQFCTVKKKSAFEPVAHQVGVYPGFRSMKRLGVFYPPPPSGWDASPSQGYPSIKFTSTHMNSHNLVKRGTMRVKCFSLEHNTVSRSGLKPWPPNLESSALNIRPLYLPHCTINVWNFFST